MSTISIFYNPVKVPQSRVLQMNIGQSITPIQVGQLTSEQIKSWTSFSMREELIRENISALFGFTLINQNMSLKQPLSTQKQFTKKDNLVKSDPIMDELLKESEASLTRIWNTGYDDDWD